MTDIKIVDGDVAVDSTGKYIRLNEKEARFQRALISITASLGDFVYDRNLGARRIDNIGSDDALQRLELVLNEALARFEDTYVTIISFDDIAVVKITIDDESRIEEVHLYGQI